MQNKLEEIVRAVYQKYRGGLPEAGSRHPDEETFACFFDEKLSGKETARVRVHLLTCQTCAEIAATYLKLKTTSEEEVPAELIAQAKDLVGASDKASVLEVFLRLKEKTLEIIRTGGEVLVGQELIPAPVLRSRSIKDFKDEVIIFKDFKDMWVEIKIENQQGRAFNLKITAKHKRTRKVIKDLRVALLKDNLELESYLSETGIVIFEHVLLGKYTVEIANIEDKLASILLDIKT